MSQYPSGPGHPDGPSAHNQFLKGVLRPPPSQFTVEMLPPTKQRGSYNFGINICPIARSSRMSVSSRGTMSGYEIWRRWEDCLWFQETLEVEYRRRARIKRKRLVKGKGVKKDGFYKQDGASSFESLPPGPDPNSVAQDIHDYLPRLSQKGTLFRASQAIIDQRHRELSALVEALLQEDVPALIQELREDRLIMDFFGYWRWDLELAEKQAQGTKVRTSVTSSLFSSYFASSQPSLPDSEPRSPSTSPHKPSRLRSSSTSTTLSSPTDSSFEESRAEMSSHTARVNAGRRRAGSTASSSSSSQRSSAGSAMSTVSSASNTTIDEIPFMYDNDPHNASFNDSSSLEPLPEGSATVAKSVVRRRVPVLLRRSNTGDSRSNRQCSIYALAPVSPTESTMTERPTAASHSSDRNVRESWQTSASAASILEGIDMMLPDTPMEYSHRMSTSSVATFMTECSVDAIIPQQSSLRRSSRRNHSRSLLSRPMSISEDEIWSDPEDLSKLYDSFPLPESSPIRRPQAPSNQSSSLKSKSSEHLTSFFPPVPSSPTPTVSTFFSVGDSSISSISGPTISIKAVHNKSIIVLRASRDISFEEVRERLYNKFVGQEGIPLSHSFTVAFVLPDRSHPSLGSPVADRATMKFVTSEHEWEQITASSDGTKLTLRILDTPQ